jgi:hypothetical protein
MLVKIYQSPFRSALEVAGDVVVKLHVPYSKTAVTVQINPNVQGYHEHLGPGAGGVRQVMFTVSSDETKTLSFEVNGTRKHRIQVGAATYDIELMSITDELVQNVNAWCFEFDVTKL